MDIKLCPECRLENPKDSGICVYCGFKLDIEREPAINGCPYCGKGIEEAAIFCRHCIRYIGDEKAEHKELKGGMHFREWGIVVAFVIIFLVAIFAGSLGAFQLAESYLTEKRSANATVNSSRKTEMAKNQETAARIAHQKTATSESAQQLLAPTRYAQESAAAATWGAKVTKRQTATAALRQAQQTTVAAGRQVLKTTIAAYNAAHTIRATGTELPTLSPTIELDILFPGATPVPCLRWDEITSTHIGQKLCVYGIVTDFTHDYEQLLIYFPKGGAQPATNFHITYKTNLFYNSPNLTVVEIGDCVKAYGVVVGPGQYPMMLISDDLPLPCDR